ncbi:hypothetical protein DFH94DRAFT_367332 [Russula ochroleuca]|uniref:Uncharacterized protein n=1 Tax=Russula ochroleuca TaxID=152965 RepID=A0A9P5MZH1_9AGAM|nr:hypothetical protein DFH94DRAFT_367332 [Russula ochroleuca]
MQFGFLSIPAVIRCLRGHSFCTLQTALAGKSPQVNSPCTYCEANQIFMSTVCCRERHFTDMFVLRLSGCVCRSNISHSDTAEFQDDTPRHSPSCITRPNRTLRKPATHP